jgi:hypothetical protein
MIDLTRVHEVEEGLQIIDGPLYTGGVDSPLVALPTPDVPTVYTQSDGTIWKHNGALTGVWQKVGVGNFSYHTVDEAITIPQNQQMTVHGEFQVTQNGCFEVQTGGSFVLKEG